MSQLTDIQSRPVAAGIEGRRAYFLAGWIVATTALFWAPLRSLIAYASENDDASHIFLIPFISAAVIYLERRAIFQRISYDLIGAAQDSSLRFGAGKSIPTAESNRATRGCGSGGPSRVMATGIKEVRSNV